VSAGQPRRKWAWHSLCDDEAARIVSEAGVRPGDLVVDIGAGDGALTRHLVSIGARVLAVELHPGRAESLRRRFAVSPVTVVQCDARCLRLPRQPFTVVANPPFYISSVLLQRLLAPGSRLKAADIVLQRPVARKYADARAPGSGRWLHTWRLELRRTLPRSAFRPPPRVDTALLRIRRRVH
jgi:23S rRNA (adenine-N6)-dimethyltransferase